MKSTYELVQDSLSYIPATNYDTWCKVGMAIKSEFGESGFSLWDRWSSNDKNYNSKDAHNKWKSFKHKGGVMIGTLFHLAIEQGWKFPADQVDKNLKKYAINNENDDKERAERAEVAAKQSQEIWDNAQRCPTHQYLDNKKIQAFDVRSIDSKECQKCFWVRNREGRCLELTGILLLIPLYNINGILRGLQAIDESGQKSFLKGMRKSGLFMPLFNEDEIKSDNEVTFYLTEGLATASTIRQITETPTLMAIDSGNLKHVALELHKKYTKANIVICADIDKGGAGQKGAQLAAESVNGSIVFPQFTDEELAIENPPSDFNDLYNLRGIEAVASSISNTINQKSFDNIDENPSTYFEKGVQLIRGSDLKPEPIKWLWNGWLAAGKFHILAGQAGTGKTTVALAFAAIISTGGRWPDGTYAEPGNILIWSGEDDWKDTLLPRLIAQGANIERIYFINGVHDGKKLCPFDPARDMSRLLSKAKELGNVSLIIIDPVVNIVNKDSHKNVEVRRDLQPLVEMGQQLNAAILGITHLTKGTAKNEPLERVTGSLAFGAVARIVFGTTKKSGIDRSLVRIKSNNGPDGGGFDYYLEEKELENVKGLVATRVVWGEPLEGTPYELMSPVDVHLNSNGNQSVLNEVKDFLLSFLKDGPMPARDTIKTAENEGHSLGTIRRAKMALKIKSSRFGFGKDSICKWELPRTTDSCSRDT